MKQKNQLALQQQYPDLYNRLQQELSDSIALRVEKTKNGMDTVVALHNGQEMYVHSRYQPEHEAEQWVHLLPQEVEVLVIIGMGLGYSLSWLARRYSNQTIIIIEPDMAMFRKATECRDLSVYLQNERFVFLVGQESYVTAHILAEYMIQNKLTFSQLCIASPPVYQRLYPDIVGELQARIADKLAELQVQEATYAYFARTWLVTTIKNAGYLSQHPSAHLIKEKLKGLPVIIAAAGPSLTKNIHLLKQAEDKALIIGVGSAINILEKHQIRPHIIMALDSAESEKNVFVNFSDTSPLLVYTHSLHPDAVAGYSGQKAWVKLKEDSIIGYICSRLNMDYLEIVDGPSVANVAFDFAIRGLRASAVLLVGQDLAYTDNRYHAAGAVHDSSAHALREEQLKGYTLTRDIYGAPVYTSRAFIAMKNFFEIYMKYEKPNIPVYNCTEGGIPLTGIPNIPLAQALEQFGMQSYPIREWIHKAVSGWDECDAVPLHSLWEELQREADILVSLSARRIRELQRLLPVSPDFSAGFARVAALTEEIDKNELYHNMIVPHVQWMVEASTRNVHHTTAHIIDEQEKKKLFVIELLRQYEEIHEYIILLQRALEENAYGTE
ncbi:motility associated factor glycosyltransferase family protein [Aneurinibacillus danicus]|uniref:DUF115 domain-containing protein n=1 Tax=Aneurinibacillus danicus TaxID=267746 RepID=A0A511V7X8_9BACL|nr:6-hydroxymethylpterin diphosphokinase MptE-like protein [Aneurinibacillus danicus]GEN35037.1 hypothetical protein ADA01nite_24970 [Aneurinibacillus danicus]